jgi:hypothetical protein
MAGTGRMGSARSTAGPAGGTGPDTAAGPGTGGGGAAAGPVIPRRDLELRPFPVIGAHDPAAQRQALADLRTWAERSAEDAMSWYLRDKGRKRTASRLLQSLAIGFAVAGTAVPLGTAATGASGQGWGYVLLAVAAGCKGFDHFFGLSSTWMRDISVAHALRGELTAVRLEWACDVLRAGPGGSDRPDDPLEPAEIERQLALIGRLVSVVRGQIDSETATWQAEFGAATRQLHEQGAMPGGADRPGA